MKLEKSMKEFPDTIQFHAILLSTHFFLDEGILRNLCVSGLCVININADFFIQ